MDSRIILSQADFSANNIGRYADLSELTKKVLAKQTQYDEQSEEAVALNTFLNNLTEDGFIGGSSPLLKTLIIPCLASQHSEMLYNIALLDNDGYPTDEMDAGEKSAASPAFVFVEDTSGHKIAIRRDGVYNPGDVIGSTEWDRVSINSHLFGTVGIAYPSFFAMAYGAGGLDGTTNIMTMQNRATNYRFLMSNSSVTLRYSSTASVSNSFNDALVGKGFYGFTYVPNTKFEGYANGGTVSDAIIVGDTSLLKTQEKSNSFAISVYVLNTAKLFRFSSIAFGNELTMSQITVLKGYFDTLMTALHVNV